MKAKAIVVVGMSGAGKTTLVRGLEPFIDGTGLVVPRRFVTRSRRNDDDSAHDLCVSRSALRSLIEHGAVDLWWSRALGGDKSESYGFEAVDADDQRPRVYAANDAFLFRPNPIVAELLKTATVVVIEASFESRKRRLQKKTIGYEERAIRLVDSRLPQWGATPSWTIDTTDLAPAEGQAAFRSLVAEVLTKEPSALCPVPCR